MEDLMRRRVRIGRVRVRVCAAPGRGGVATGESGNLCAMLAEGSPQERMHAAMVHRRSSRGQLGERCNERTAPRLLRR